MPTQLREPPSVGLAAAEVFPSIPVLALLPLFRHSLSGHSIELLPALAPILTHSVDPLFLTLSNRCCD